MALPCSAIQLIRRKNLPLGGKQAGANITLVRTFQSLDRSHCLRSNAVDPPAIPRRVGPIGRPRLHPREAMPAPWIHPTQLTHSGTRSPPAWCHKTCRGFFEFLLSRGAISPSRSLRLQLSQCPPLLAPKSNRMSLPISQSPVFLQAPLFASVVLTTIGAKHRTDQR